MSRYGRKPWSAKAAAMKEQIVLDRFFARRASLIYGRERLSITHSFGERATCNHVSKKGVGFRSNEL
jgi:hypothetical protein